MSESSKVSRSAATVDIAILASVVGGFWSLRFLGVQYVGVITMGAGIVTVAALLRWRGQGIQDIGWKVVFRGRELRSRTLEVMGLTGGALLLGGLVGGAVFGAPEQAAAVSQLSKNVWFFLLDVTVLTWLFIAFGEELVFRGLFLARLESLLALKEVPGVVVPSLLQGIVFGAAHASQGVTGMIMTGTVGTALAMYFLTRGQRCLIPLVISHGIIDTTVLSASWFVN